MDHDERLLASALHQLSPAEEAALQSDLNADPALRRQWEDLYDTLAALVDDLDLSAVSVPVDAEDRLIARLHADQQTGHSPAPVGATLTLPAVNPTVDQHHAGHPDPARPARRPAWWVALPLTLAAAVALLFALRPPADPTQQYARTPGATSMPVVAGGQTLGTLIRLADGRVFVHLIRPADTGRTYQLWQIQAGTPVSLGVFGEGGLLTAALPGGAIVAVSVEPTGGSAQPTTKPLFAQPI